MLRRTTTSVRRAHVWRRRCCDCRFHASSSNRSGWFRSQNLSRSGWQRQLTHLTEMRWDERFNGQETNENNFVQVQQVRCSLNVVLMEGARERWERLSVSSLTWVEKSKSWLTDASMDLCILGGVEEVAVAVDVVALTSSTRAINFFSRTLSTSICCAMDVGWVNVSSTAGPNGIFNKGEEEVNQLFHVETVKKMIFTSWGLFLFFL